MCVLIITRELEVNPVQSSTCCVHGSLFRYPEPKLNCTSQQQTFGFSAVISASKLFVWARLGGSKLLSGFQPKHLGFNGPSSASPLLWQAWNFTSGLVKNLKKAVIWKANSCKFLVVHGWFASALLQKANRTRILLLLFITYQSETSCIFNFDSNVARLQIRRSCCGIQHCKKRKKN